jgi:hypothetical protein
VGINRYGEYGKREGPEFPYLRGFRITQMGGGGGRLRPFTINTGNGREYKKRSFASAGQTDPARRRTCFGPHPRSLQPRQVRQ